MDDAVATRTFVSSGINIGKRDVVRGVSEQATCLESTYQGLNSASSADADVDENSGTCAVCLEELCEPIRWPSACGHSFCLICTLRLRSRQSPSCPLCRAPAAPLRLQDESPDLQMQQHIPQLPTPVHANGVRAHPSPYRSYERQGGVPHTSEQRGDESSYEENDGSRDELLLVCVGSWDFPEGCTRGLQMRTLREVAVADRALASHDRRIGVVLADRALPGAPGRVAKIKGHSAFPDGNIVLVIEAGEPFTVCNSYPSLPSRDAWGRGGAGSGGMRRSKSATAPLCGVVKLEERAASRPCSAIISCGDSHGANIVRTVERTVDDSSTVALVSDSSAVASEGSPAILSRAAPRGNGAAARSSSSTAARNRASSSGTSSRMQLPVPARQMQLSRPSSSTSSPVAGAWAWQRHQRPSSGGSDGGGSAVAPVHSRASSRAGRQLRDNGTPNGSLAASCSSSSSRLGRGGVFLGINGVSDCLQGTTGASNLRRCGSAGSCRATRQGVGPQEPRDVSRTRAPGRPPQKSSSAVTLPAAVTVARRDSS